MTKQRALHRLGPPFLLVLLLACLLVTDRAAVSAPIRAAASRESPQDQGAVATSQATLSGTFLITWGDPDPAPGLESRMLYELASGDETIRLLFQEELAQPWGGVLALNGRRVAVRGEWLDGPSRRAERTVRVLAIQPEAGTMPPGEQGGADTGPAAVEPWISVLCKFADVPGEPKALPYFQEMYRNTFPGLDHYWREVSYGAISLSGSGAVGWYTLPHARSAYVYDSDGDGDLEVDNTALANDCTGVADPDVYFPQYRGVNLMFNSELDGWAYGGTRVLSRDGQTRLYGITWIPGPWYQMTLLQHEMGHGMGLPHSSGNYGRVYDNVWDVMSGNWICGPFDGDPTYGCIGQDTIAYHLGLMGWLPAERQGYVGVGSQASFPLEQLYLPQAEGYLVVRIPIQGSPTAFYTVEARRKLGYDHVLPAEGVIIHEVVTDRGIPAHVVDVDGDGDTRNAYFSVGQSFVDAANGIMVTVSYAPGGSMAPPDVSHQALLPASVPSPLRTGARLRADGENTIYLPFVSGPRRAWLVTITNAGR